MAQVYALNLDPKCLQSVRKGAKISLDRLQDWNSMYKNDYLGALHRRSTIILTKLLLFELPFNVETALAVEHL